MELTKRVAHKPFIHEVPHAKGVVLFIHGILEGPYQFRGLADIANQNGYSSYAILLPGHGDSAERFSRIEKRLSTDYYCWSFDGVFTRPFNFFTLSTDKKSFFNFNTVKIKIKF